MPPSLSSISGPALITLLTFILASGCSDDATVPAEDFAAQYAETYCSYLTACCDSSERSYGSLEACRRATNEALARLLAFRSSPDPRASFQEVEAASCLERLDAQRCAEDPELALGCMNQAVRYGSKVGEPCISSAECESYYCIQDAEGALGKCGLRNADRCSGDDRACPDTRFCSPVNECVTRLAGSSPCTRAEECQSGICSASLKICAVKQDPFCDGK